MSLLNKFVTDATELGGVIGGPVGNSIQGAAGLIGKARDLKNFAFGPKSNTVAKGAENNTASSTVTAKFTNQRDWRVTLSLPTNGFYAREFKLLDPENSGKFVFPFTPIVNLTHTANYSAMEPIHNNYSFAAYENSKIDKITITGDFYCENANDARYWTAGVHFFRSVTKMFFGEKTPGAGAPPPILKLNGYGDFVFADVPVVVTSFAVELPKDVDYISTSFSNVGTFLGTNSTFTVTGNTGYAPTKSVFNVTLMPVYSRESVRKFDLNSFVRGDYVGATAKSTGKGGFI